MDECIDTLGDAMIFSTWHANSRYWQIEIAEGDRARIAFASDHGLLGYIHMPSGLKKALDAFQRALDVILSTVN